MSDLMLSVQSVPLRFTDRFTVGQYECAGCRFRSPPSGVSGLTNGVDVDGSVQGSAAFRVEARDDASIGPEPVVGGELVPVREPVDVADSREVQRPAANRPHP